LALKLRKVTPRGVAIYPHLTKPDTQYGEHYKLRLAVPLDKAKPLIDELKAAAKEEFGEKASKARMPYTIDKEEGTATFKFKSSYKPALFDKRGQKLETDPLVGGGSVVKAEVTFKSYSGKGQVGIGITAYLHSVQVITLREPSPFGEEMDDDEGVSSSGFGDESDESDSDEDTSSDDDDDDLDATDF
jgi:hypothetical protein